MKVYEVEYYNGIDIIAIKIRAFSKNQAFRIAKQFTGAFIKDMRIGCVYGWSEKAYND